MKNHYFWAALLFVSNLSLAQLGSLDPSLNPGIGADASVQTIVQQADQKILAGGDFQTYDGSAIKRLVRLHADGSKDNSFNIGSGFNKVVMSVVVQPDQKILVGGEFTIFNNTSRKRIMRLNSDGSADVTFNTGYGANDNVLCIYLQDDAKIMVGGLFTSMNWMQHAGIARLNADGSVDAGFHYDGDPIEVAEIKQLSDGKYLVNAVTKIIRLNHDGSIDTTFNSGSGTDYPIQALLVQADGKIVVGGYFTMYDNFSFQRILRLMPDGTIDTTFNIGAAADYGVLAMSEQYDGKILITGLFANYGGVPREKVARLHPDGTLDESVNPGLGPDNIVLDHFIQMDGRMLIAGDFNQFDGVTRNKIARVSVNEFLGVNSQKLQNVVAYPNPVNDVLMLSLPMDTQVLSMTVADVSGKTVISQSNSNALDVSSLSAGLYIVTANTAAGRFQTKFIKQ